MGQSTPRANGLSTGPRVIIDHGEAAQRREIRRIRRLARIPLAVINRNCWTFPAKGGE